MIISFYFLIIVIYVKMCNGCSKVWVLLIFNFLFFYRDKECVVNYMRIVENMFYKVL